MIKPETKFAERMQGVHLDWRALALAFEWYVLGYQDGFERALDIQRDLNNTKPIVRDDDPTHDEGAYVAGVSAPPDRINLHPNVVDRKAIMANARAKSWTPEARRKRALTMKRNHRKGKKRGPTTKAG